MNIKKLSSIFLAVAMSFYGVIAMTPALARADSGDHGKKENHGSVVSAVARSHSEDGDRNHGSVVSTVAKDNHGHSGDNENDNDNENENEHANNNEHGNGNGGGNNGGSVATTTANVATNPATNVTSANATLNGLNGPTAAAGHSFWVSLAPFVTTSPTIPSGVYSTPDFGAIAANTTFSTSLSSLTTAGVPGNLPAITPGTKYYFVAWSLVGGTWYPGSVKSFTTSATTTPADTTSPSVIFATNLGLSASTTSVIWVTNEASNSKIWFGTTTPVATTTSPMVSSGTLSFFHQLNLPVLATSTLYYYTISSTDSSGNIGYYSTSFTTLAI